MNMNPQLCSSRPARSTRPARPARTTFDAPEILPLLTDAERKELWRNALDADWDRSTYLRKYGLHALDAMELCRKSARKRDENAFLAAMGSLSWALWLNEPDEQKRAVIQGRARESQRERENHVRRISP